MAVKDIKIYYDEVCDQYHELINELHDFEKEAEQGFIEPERLEQIQKSIQPIINNYQMLSYIIFLLNKPARKEKYKKYEKQNRKLLEQIAAENTKQGVLNQNKNVLDTVFNNK